MDQTFHQLGQLLFSTIPTVLIFLVLHFYLRGVLYKPLRQVLSARAEKIEGREAAAVQARQQAEGQLAAYEAALRQGRQESYRRIEAQRQAGLAASQATLAAARQQAGEGLTAARQQLAAETAQARLQLQGRAEGLAQQILQQILGGVRPSHSGQSAPGAGA